MTKGLPILLVALAAPFAAAPSAFGQSAIQVSITANGKSSNVPAGGSLAVTANDLGQSILANVTVHYSGTTTATITGVSVTGTSEMTLLVAPQSPTTLSPNGSTSFTLQYLPSSGNSVSAQVSVAFTENSQASTFPFTLIGTSPRLTFSYYFAPNGSLNDINPGDRITFPATNVGSSVQAVISVLNRGTATGSLQSITLSGSAFQLTGPPTPAQVQPGQQAFFNVTFAPQATGGSQGLLNVEFPSGTVTFSLTGTGASIGFSFAYTLADGNIRPLTSGAAINFPSVDTNGTTTATITILNQGTGSGTVTGIAVSGAGFQLSGLPLLPATIPAGQSLRFAIVFAPTQTGTFNGTFRIDLVGASVSGTLTASTNVSSFTLSYTLADGNVRPLTAGAAIGFPSVDINGTTTATITILNQGAGAGTVNGISVTGTGFQLSGIPLLPATVPAGQSLRFGIVFAPTQPGAFNGFFSIALSGSSISGTLAASTNASNFTASYTFPNSVVNPLFSGAVIAFPAVDVNGTISAAVTVLNQGAGAGTVTAISVGGSGFLLTGLPALPATVPAGQSLKFNIVFAPTQTGAFNGNFAIALNGTSISGALTGSTTAPNFSLSYVLADSIVHTLPAGATISFPAIDINGNTTATITILNQGAGAGTLTAISLGGSGFQLSGVPLLPANVPAGQSLRIGIVFNPTQAGTYTGTFRIDMTGSTISGSLSGSTAASNISLAYIDPDTNNTVPLSNNSTLPFPNTLAGAVSTITVVVSNSGAGTGFINSLTFGGSSASVFQLLNLPVLPVSVAPSQQVRFGIRFSPQQQQAFSAALLVATNSQSLTINLAAQGTGPQFTYTWTAGSGTTALLPNATLPIADTAVGQTTSVILTITNNGTGDGQISSVGVTGQGLALTGLPAGAITLHANASQQFTLTFAPQQPGSVKGQLAIGSDTFAITATGVGAKLTYSYTNAAVVTPVAESGAVIFSPSPVGTSESLVFSIQNTGTSAATISSINLTAASSVFSLQQLPALPLSLNPGVTITLSAAFLPNNTGTVTATLAVNSSTFTLSGTGAQPAPLPAFQFQGPSGNQQPAQQPAVGLALASPFALPLKGTLTLTFASSVFTDDPSIQFASGGRTINFTIPANTTQALFNGSATTVPIQTGTTAGTLVITPSFAMQGGFDMTPASPNVLSLTVQRSVPQLLNASVTSQTTSSFTVLLSGYSTSRNLRQLDIQITPQQGSTLSSTHLTIDVSSSASSWFQSAASQPFGGTFSVAIPFVLQNGNTGQDLVHLLQSLSITATNDVGGSNALPVSIP